MRHQPVGPHRRAGAFGAAEGQEDHEPRKGPVADHDDHQGVVFARQMLGKPVLRRKGGDGGDHVPDAQGRVAGGRHRARLASTGSGPGEGRVIGPGEGVIL